MAAREDARFADLDVKESWSEAVPFRRLSSRSSARSSAWIAPRSGPSANARRAVDAATLARWLDAGRDDAGRPVVTLDTRNAFEVDHGRFAGAIDWRLGRSSATSRPPSRRTAGALAGKTVVSYCTGGIRCEKAALLMREAGVENVLQLDGGILKYFERDRRRGTSKARCFVFDGRETLSPALVATPV